MAGDQDRGPRGFRGAQGNQGNRGVPGAAPLEEVARLLRRQRFRWRVYFASLAAVVVAIAVVAWMGFTAEQERTRSDLEAANERAKLACESRQDFRAALRAVVNYATEPTGELDLTAVPGFDDLDPASRVYFENLTVRLAGNPDRGEAFRDFTDGLLPAETC